MQMTSWWSQIFGTKESPEAERPPSRSRPPVLPFECYQNDESPIGRRLHRPLVYAFEHAVLPHALFNNHPELMQALQPTPTRGMAFLHMWSQSATMCESRGIWPEDSILGDDGEGYQAYAQPFIESVTCVPTRTDRFTVWTLTTPAPLMPGETYFVALCRMNNDTNGYGQMSFESNYFTSEMTEDGKQACFCEWDFLGGHRNYGATPIETADSFTQRVIKTASGPRPQPVSG
jgi:hypothetical protein